MLARANGRGLKRQTLPLPLTTLNVRGRGLLPFLEVTSIEVGAAGLNSELASNWCTIFRTAFVVEVN